jgi:histidinol phosphatase-like PHP family hydrolase
MTHANRSTAARLTRRTLMGGAAAAGLTLLLPSRTRSEESPVPATFRPDLPRLDLHAHPDNSTIDAIVALAGERGVRLGMVEHAGTKLNKYPVVLATDAELAAWIDSLAGKGVYAGVQAEWTDWMGCFSRPVLARLDYVLTDAMTYPGKDGLRVKLWEADAPDRVDMADHEAFMERYVEWYVAIMERQPIDVLANVSWLPKPLADAYDALWTPARIRRVADTAARLGVAIEISSGFVLPRIGWLKVAREAGVKFSFGSNGRYPKMGLLDYSLRTADALGLKAEDFFTPGVAGQKAVERRKW